MVKSPSLLTYIAGSVRLVTLILARMVAGPTTLQGLVPETGAAPMMMLQVAPPSRDSSILTFPLRLAEDQVTFCVLPIAQVTGPVGLESDKRAGPGVS